MRKNRKTFIAAALAFSLAVMLFVFGSDRAENTESPKWWGKGNITEVERTYYISQLSEITKRWRRLSRSQMRSNRSRSEEFLDYYLVVDMDKGAIWIERSGQIVPGCYSELAPNMGWKFLRVTDQERKELKGRTHFKIRGRNSKLSYPEEFYFAGRGRGLSYLHFSFKTNGTGTSYGTGKRMISLLKSTASEKDMYKSMVVEPDEYEEYLERVASKGKVEQDEKTLPVLERNLINWRKVQKRLYWEINRQLQLEGFEVRNLEIAAGPDFSAGHAVITARKAGILNRALRGYRNVDWFFKFDCLGSDVWYVKSGTYPTYQNPNFRNSGLDLEFLVCANGKIPRTEHQTWLEKGRAKQPFMIRPESKWQVTLSNGVKIEFIGICENPSANKQWWGPDGSALDYVPHVNWEVYGQRRDDRMIYEMIWKIKSPGNQGIGSTSSFEGSKGSYSRRTLDRYGNDLHNMNVDGYGFDKTREKTTWKAGFRVGSGDNDWVRFKNISLVRGKNFGFEILRGEE
ncbi:MAG: hypothetical protein ACYSWP_19505 [Planctomycetota bacterium]|jgi:hypothetical protein